MRISILILFMSALFVSCSENIVEPTFERIPAEQNIKILYKYWFADEVNTFDKTLTKDLVSDGVTTIDFWFQPDEQNEIIKIVDEVDFWSIRDTINQNPEDSIYVVICPDPGLQVLTIEYKGRTKTVTWFMGNDYEDEYQRINRITDLILEIISIDSAYKNLPAPNGAYL